MREKIFQKIRMAETKNGFAPKWLVSIIRDCLDEQEAKTCENCKSLSWCDVYKLVEDDCTPDDFYCKDFQKKG